MKTLEKILLSIPAVMTLASLVTLLFHPCAAMFIFLVLMAYLSLMVIYLVWKL